MDYDRIITHGDFDGVVSGAICSFVLGVDTFIFTGPGAITRAEISIGPRDVVCDLPYPLECGLWFDHHPGNREALALRGIDPAGIPGRLDGTKPSAARVVFEYFSERAAELPARFAETVAEADTIDSFDYRTIDEWLRETPGKLVDMSLKAPASGLPGAHEVPRPARSSRARRFARGSSPGRGRGRARRAIPRRGEAHGRVPEEIDRLPGRGRRSRAHHSRFHGALEAAPRAQESRVPPRARSARGPDREPGFPRRSQDDRHFHLDVPLHEHDRARRTARTSGRSCAPSISATGTSAPRRERFIPRPRTRCPKEEKGALRHLEALEGDRNEHAPFDIDDCVVRARARRGRGRGRAGAERPRPRRKRLETYDAGRGASRRRGKRAGRAILRGGSHGRRRARGARGGSHRSALPALRAERGDRPLRAVDAGGGRARGEGYSSFI